MRIFFALLIVLPIIEIVVLVKVGGLIGVLPTIALILLTAMIGVFLLKRQSWETMQRAQAKMGSGQIPAQEMAEGLFLAVGGALLLTPGFVTDFIGFCCLLPFTRQLLLAKCIAPIMKSFNFQTGSMGAGFGHYSQGNTFEGNTYEGHAEEHSETPFRVDQQKHKNSPSERNGDSDIIDGEYRRED